MRLLSSARHAAAAAAVAALALAAPVSAFAGHGIITKKPGGGTPGGRTLACVDITIPGVTKIVTFTAGDLVFTYDPTGTCGASGGSTGGAPGGAS